MRNMHIPSRVTLFVLIMVVTAALTTSSSNAVASSSSSSQLAPLKQANSPNKIKDRYIVKFKSTSSSGAHSSSHASSSAYVSSMANEARAQGMAVSHEYSTAFQGMTVTANPAQLEALRKNKNVEYVEADQEVQMAAIQYDAIWGLDRIDQANLPLNNTYVYNRTGQGVHAYIIDSGIYSGHPEFSGRVGWGADFIENDNSPQDCNGHGTHVAGTIGGTYWGVAKNVTLHAVRIFGCGNTGNNSTIIAGIDWVAQYAEKPAVANLSLTGGASSAMDNAVQGLHDSGVTPIVAAGNDNANACYYSPARSSYAVTVGATTYNDARVNDWWGSNWGECVNIWAPGWDIWSANYTSNGGLSRGGTSMATPHVVGVVALYLESNRNATPAQVIGALFNGSVSGKVTGGGGAANRLLNTAYISGGGSSSGGSSSGGSSSGGSSSGGSSSGGVTTLIENQSITISGQEGSEKHYKYTIPTGGVGKVETWQGSGDLDLYVKKGSTPTLNDYDCRSWTPTTVESCLDLGPGTYFVLVHGFKAYSNVKIKGMLTSDSGPTVTTLQENSSIVISGAQGSEKFYKYTIPSGGVGKVVTWQGNGNPNLYVRKGSLPTLSSYDCRSTSSGTVENCLNLGGGTYYVLVHGASSYSSVKLKGRLTQ